MARPTPAWHLVSLATLIVCTGVALACNSMTGADDIVLTGGTAPQGGSGQGAASTGGGGSGAGHTTGGAGAAGGQGGGGGEAPDPCAAVLCSGHGSCVVGAGDQPECDCEQGYHAVGLECVVDETCSGVQCDGRCRLCEVIEGLAECVCPDGFAFDGNDCRPSPDPCDQVTCNAGWSCIPEHHCTIDPTCVPNCDCSNCGTCSMQDFVNAGTQVLYCGSGQSAPATMACTNPCPPGWGGCLPYSPGICWPAQGCMSL